MEYIDLGRHYEALGDMLMAHLGEHGYTDSQQVEVPTALLIIEVAKRAPDREEWFPLGKWATIQALQSRVGWQLDRLFGGKP